MASGKLPLSASYLSHWTISISPTFPQNDPDKEAISGFERAYNRWQQILERQYPPWMDTDGDGFTNQEEFLYGTDPNHPTLVYNPYPGIIPIQA